MELIISLIAGALGGNLMGAMAKNLSQGTVMNSILGIVGGGLGGWILSAMGMGGQVAADATAATAGIDIGTIIGQIAGGGVGGGVLMLIVGMIKNAMAK